MATTPPYAAVEDARGGGAMILPLEEDGLNLRKMIFTSFKDNGLIYCPAHKIPIIIDPAILTVIDEKTVKDAVWDIVEVEIEKYKEIIKGRKFAVPAKEPADLAAVLRCRSETFEKYLRWYDFNIGEGLSFRLIALIEFHSKPEDKEHKFKEHICKKKRIRNIGPVEEEDMVRKGVGLIYQAIFRKPMSAREDHTPTLKEYNCPYHNWNPNTQDWDCDADCEYLKSYIARLSRCQ